MNYVLSADNSFQRDEELDRIKRNIMKDKDTELIEINAQDKSWTMSSLLNDLNTVPWIQEHRLIILNNATFLGAKGSLDEASVKELELYLKNPAPFSTLIIVCDGFKMDARKKVVKVVKKYMEVFEPKELDDYAMKSIIDEDLKSLNISMDYNTKEELYKRALAQFDYWPQERIKLELYNKKELSLEDVKLLICDNNLNTVFDLSNAVLKKDLKNAMGVYQSLAISDREPIALIMLLASQFRLIHQIQTLMNANIAYDSIAQKIKVHPYRVKMLKPVVTKTESIEILSVLNQLSTLEQSIKGGTVEPNIGFELFLIGACS